MTSFRARARSATTRSPADSTPGETQVIPLEALQASLGCGNPTALAELRPGQTVLDLGSGGGIDVLLSARRVGPEGFAYGLDMTDDMLALAEQNRRKPAPRMSPSSKGRSRHPAAGRRGGRDHLQLRHQSLRGQRPGLREAFRVLRPGGRFAVSDVVAQGELPDDLRADMEAWVGCVAGALEEGEYRRLLAEAGFGDIDLEVTRVYDPQELGERRRWLLRQLQRLLRRWRCHRLGRERLRTLRRVWWAAGERLRPRSEADLNGVTSPTVTHP